MWCIFDNGTERSGMQLARYRGSLYRGSTVVGHAIWTVINWYSLTCCIGKLAKGWELTMPLCSISSYLVIQNTMKDAKNQSLWTKTNTVSKDGKGTFVVKFSTKLPSLYSLWKRSFRHIFITWTLVWVLSVSRSHDISISLEKRLQVNEQLNVVYSRLSVPGSLRDKYINNSNLPIKLYRYLPLRSSPKYKHTSRNRANQQRIQATTWPQEGGARQQYSLCLFYKRDIHDFSKVCYYKLDNLSSRLSSYSS